MFSKRFEMSSSVMLRAQTSSQSAFIFVVVCKTRLILAISDGYMFVGSLR
jgi:hypothetical protein